MAAAHVPPRLAGAEAELEDRPGVDAVRRSRDLLLELVVGGDLAPHRGAVAVRSEVELAHARKSSRRSAAVAAAYALARGAPERLGLRAARGAAPGAGGVRL